VAIITENLQYKTTWDFAAETAKLLDKVEHAKCMLSRRYIFVGETHTSPHDKKRTQAVATSAANDNEIIMVAERSIFESSLLDPIEARTASLSSNVLHETDTTSSSASMQRNIAIVQQIIAECARDNAIVNNYGQRVNRGHTNPRTVLILFGQEHERHIKDQLMQQLERTDKICWWSFPSFQDEVDQLADLSNPSTVGFVPVAACDLREQTDPNAAFQRICKGQPAPAAGVAVKLTAPYAKPSITAGLVPVTRILHVRAARADLVQAIGTGMDRGSGSFTLTVNAGNQADVKLLPVRDRDHYATLVGEMEAALG
jgi:hypothetical protein